MPANILFLEAGWWTQFKSHVLKIITYYYLFVVRVVVIAIRFRYKYEFYCHTQQLFSFQVSSYNNLVIVL